MGGSNMAGAVSDRMWTLGTAPPHAPCHHLAIRLRITWSWLIAMPDAGIAFIPTRSHLAQLFCPTNNGVHLRPPGTYLNPPVSSAETTASLLTLLD